MADKNGVRQRRKAIPFRPENAAPNYLKMLKNAVGSKDLCRSAMPVEFNEPLSMLQRQTEELEYAHLLDLAALEGDQSRRLAFICAFAISGYSTVGSRPTKPFNPLLGETFECDRRGDRGWRSVAEQISHHPPGSALHVEGQAWTLDQQYLVESKMKGTSLCLSPIGQTTIRFKDGQSYSYGKLSTSTSLDSILNWSSPKNGTGTSTNGNNSTECTGQVSVNCLNSLAKTVLTFHANKKGQQPRKVTGTVFDANGKETLWIEAQWDKWARMWRSDPANGKESTDFEHIWAVNELPADSHRMHNFTQFAVELNEEVPGICPTDSRRRPDQRLCELGEFGAANRVKKCLEEAQRVRLRELQQAGKEYHPLWFAPISGTDRRPSNGKIVPAQLAFTGDYWKAKEAQNWEACPEIFAV